MNHPRIISTRSPFHLTGLFLLLLAEAAAGDGLLLNTPPAKPIRIPAEFEPTQAVIADWQEIYDKDFFRYIAEDVKLILLWKSVQTYNAMQRDLPKYGVNMDNCEFYQVSYIPILRDGLPWFLFTDHNQPAFVYNQPAFGTRSIPQYGLEQGYLVYYSGLNYQGGDFMTDGQGTAVSFKWIDPPMSDKLMERVRDYWGVDTYHFVDDVTQLVKTRHIDCVAKFLTPDTIMVVRVRSSDPVYKCAEDAAAYFPRQVSCYGTPYRVVRLDALNSEPYINSLIVNRRVFVPVFGRATDAATLASYQTAMPGYEVIGIRNGGQWNQFWALHCDTMQIADEQMLYIEHVPLLDRPPTARGFPIRAAIEAFSGAEFVEGTPVVLWRTVIDANESQPSADWSAVAMARDPESGDHRYLAYIPAQPVGTVVQYYLQAKDASGRDETHPYVGRAQAHTFTVTTLGAGVSAVSACRGGTIEFYINAGVDKAQRPYRLACSVSADPNSPEAPDTALPDTAVLTGFDGTLDDSGIGMARLTFPEPLASEWVARTLRFSLELADPSGALPDTVSIQILE